MNTQREKIHPVFWVMAALVFIETGLLMTAVVLLGSQVRRQQATIQQQAATLAYFTSENKKASYLHCVLYADTVDNDPKFRQGHIYWTPKIRKVYFVYEDGTRGYWQEKL